MKILPFGQSALNYLYGQYKLVAKKRKLPFKLTKKYFETLTKQPCFYCGKEPSQVCSKHGGYGIYIYNGIDRIDNSVGYIKDNCRPCCRQCNWAKGKLTAEEFRLWVEKIYINLIGKEK